MSNLSHPASGYDPQQLVWNPNMKHLLAALTLSAAALTPDFAAAETMDVATVKCSDLATVSGDEGAFLFAWLLGYAGGQAGITTLDISAMESLGQRIGEYCGANPDVGVLSATTEILSE